MKREISTFLDYFPSGVPPKVFFKMGLEDLELIVENFDDSGPLNVAAETCLIGLTSYFEAFCKNQFASLLNICPQILNEFIKGRKELSFTLQELLDFDLNIKENIGFLLAEKYDFGSADSINSLFGGLLSFTPFSAKDKKKFDKFLADRNLLVHHGGTYTYKYKKQHLQKTVNDKRVFFDSIVIKKKEYLEYADFINEMVEKIAFNSQKNINKIIDANNWALTGHAFKAIDQLCVEL